MTVHLGRYNISKTNENDIEVASVEEIVMHPDWNSFERNYDADLAILKLGTRISRSNFIAVACWPSIDTDRIGESMGEGVVVSYHMRPVSSLLIIQFNFKVGWGFSERSKSTEIEDIARQAVITAVSNEYCFLHKSELTFLSSNRTFCAGGNGKLISGLIEFVMLNSVL